MSLNTRPICHSVLILRFEKKIGDMKVTLHLNYIIAIITCSVIISCSGKKRIQENESVPLINIRDYLVRSAQEITGESLAGIQSKADWERMKPARYSEFI
jgi:hypothetical protein